jgi:hypothetical protein
VLVKFHLHEFLFLFAYVLTWDIVSVSGTISARDMPLDLSITLRYSGRDVDEGTMPIDEVVDSLQGFAGSYSKIAALRSSGTEYQLKVAGVRTGSFDLVIQAWSVLQQVVPPTAIVYQTVEGAHWIVRQISNVIGIKKHVKAQPYTVNVRGNDNTVIVINNEGGELSVQPEALEIFRERLIDADLNKIVSPLREGSVDSAEIRVNNESSAIIESTEREYFRPDPSVATTRQMEVVGKLISLNKETSRGSFKLGDGKNVRYHYVGEDRDGFHRDFAHSGPVRVTGEVTFDTNLVVVHIDIQSVVYLQPELPFTDEVPLRNR